MNPDFEKIKNVLAIIRRVLLSVCALVITVGVLILLRSLINAEFLRSYNSGRYSPIPAAAIPRSPRISCPISLSARTMWRLTISEMWNTSEAITTKRSITILWHIRMVRRNIPNTMRNVRSA